MTSAAAQVLHDRITAAGEWCLWLVRPAPGGYLAQAMVADHSGGRQEGDELHTATLDELRALLPSGLKRGEPLLFCWAEVVETWD